MLKCPIILTYIINSFPPHEPGSGESSRYTPHLKGIIPAGRYVIRRTFVRSIVCRLAIPLLRRNRKVAKCIKRLLVGDRASLSVTKKRAALYLNNSRAAKIHAAPVKIGYTSWVTDVRNVRSKIGACVHNKRDTVRTLVRNVKRKYCKGSHGSNLGLILEGRSMFKTHCQERHYLWRSRGLTVYSERWCFKKKHESGRG